MSATGRAQDAVLALRVPAGDFRSLLMVNSEVSKRVQQLASERLTRTAKMAPLAGLAETWNGSRSVREGWPKYG